jgi:hypothetical protein
MEHGEGHKAGGRVLCSARISRHKQELKLVLHALDRLLDQVHVLAAEAQRLLPTGVEVDDPVHGQLAGREGAVPAAAE